MNTIKINGIVGGTAKSLVEFKDHAGKATKPTFTVLSSNPNIVTASFDGTNVDFEFKGTGSAKVTGTGSDSPKHTQFGIEYDVTVEPAPVAVPAVGETVDVVFHTPVVTNPLVPAPAPAVAVA